MNIKRKLLLAGGSYADIPLIKAAKKLGFYVISSGNRADDLGHKEADHYSSADFSDPEAILKIAKQYEIDIICSSCNDFSAISAGYVAEQLGLPGHDSFETCKLLHHKDSYRSFAMANNIPTPMAESFSDPAAALNSINKLSFPVIIKPVDLTGGKGITRIDHLSDAKPAIERAFAISKCKRIVIEEFITGTRHGFSAFVRKGKVVFYFSDNEHYYLNPYMVSAASTPSIVPQNAINDLIKQSEEIVSLLSLKDGIFHVQYILHNNSPIIIEICRRAPGDLYIKFVEYATNVDYATWIVKAAAGMGIDELEFVQPKGFFTRHCVMGSQNGRVGDVIFDKSITNNIIDQFMWWKPGYEITDCMISKLGIVFLKFDSFEEMMGKTIAMNDLIHIIYNQN